MPKQNKALGTLSPKREVSITKIKNKMLENFLAKFKKKDNKQSISFVEVPTQYETELFRIAQDRYHVIKEVN